VPHREGCRRNTTAFRGDRHAHEEEKAERATWKASSNIQVKRYDLGLPYDFLFRDKELRQKVMLILILAGTIQRFLKLMIRICLKTEVLNSFAEFHEERAKKYSLKVTMKKNFLKLTNEIN
jgi:hypothetical protein